MGSHYIRREVSVDFMSHEVGEWMYDASPEEVADALVVLADGMRGLTVSSRADIYQQIARKLDSYAKSMVLNLADHVRGERGRG